MRVGACTTKPWCHIVAHPNLLGQSVVVIGQGESLELHLVDVLEESWIQWRQKGLLIGESGIKVRNVQGVFLEKNTS